jgi:hypothetical protein
MSANQRNTIFLQLSRLLRDLQQRAPEDFEGALREVIDNAARAVPGARWAGITVADRDGKVETISPSHSNATKLDDIQRRTREGPCLAAAWRHEVIRVDDLASETRWPRFCAEALAETEVRSVLSFDLFADRRQMGALNFLSDRTHAFDEQSVEIGLIMATNTALAWTMLTRDEQFRGALASRDLIGQAKGMIMERFDIDSTAAFELLKKLSQNSNTSIAEISADLVRRPRAEP